MSFIPSASDINIQNKLCHSLVIARFTREFLKISIIIMFQKSFPIVQQTYHFPFKYSRIFSKIFPKNEHYSVPIFSHYIICSNGCPLIYNCTLGSVFLINRRNITGRSSGLNIIFVTQIIQKLFQIELPKSVYRMTASQ